MLTGVSAADRPTVSVVMPCFNEEASACTTIERAQRALERLASGHEILVVDDGSVDRTCDVVRERFGGDARVKVLVHPKNRGLGAAISTGMAAATCDHVVTLCADGQFDPEEYEAFLKERQQADVIIGYRVSRVEHARRQFVSSVYRKVIRVLFGLTVRDPGWIKMFRREHVPLLATQSEGFFWETEVLVRAQDAGLTIHEVPVNSFARQGGEAKGAQLWRIYEAVKRALTFWWSHRREPRRARTKHA
jgi:glycosyltransferase involved in cell wall biosynthesis